MEGSGSGAGDITVLPAGLSVKAQGNIPGAAISVQDFQVLMEGAGTSHDATVRDVMIGVAVTSITTVSTLWASTTLWAKQKLQDGSEAVVPNWGPFIVFVALGFIGVVALIQAILSHRRSKGDHGRESYNAVVSRLQRELRLSERPK